MTKPIYKWKFLLQPNHKGKISSQHGKDSWKLDEWHSVKGNIKACKNGYHCSDGILQALSYVKGEVLAKVEVRGDNDVESDKSAWREMRIVEMYQWRKEDSVAFAIYAAEQVIKIYEDRYPNDSRPRDAIKAAKEWLRDPSKESTAAARAAATAAYDAAADAAYAADADAAYAAYAAARAAATAAYDAAAAAADAAAAAAYAAAADAAAYAAGGGGQVRAKLERWMKARVKKLQVAK